MNLTPEQLAAIAEAFGLPSDATYEDVVAAVGAWLKQVQDAANGNAAPPAADGGDGSGDTGGDATGDPAAMAASFMRKLGAVVTLAAAKRGTDKELVALRTAVFNTTERTTALDALNVLSAWKNSFVTLEAQRAALEKDRKVIEANARREYVAELVKCGAETPASAWAKDKDGVTDATTPAPIFMRMTIDELRDHVAAKKAQHKAGAAGGHQPPPGTEGDGGKDFLVEGKAVRLTKKQLDMCVEKKIDPATYAAKLAKSPIK